MNKDDHLQHHLELCKRIYLSMQAENSWPWKEQADSTNPENLVESEDLTDDL